MKLNLLSDNVRAGIIATVMSLFPVLQLMGIVSLTGDDISILMLFVTNTTNLIFLIVKSETVVLPG